MITGTGSLVTVIDRFFWPVPVALVAIITTLPLKVEVGVPLILPWALHVNPVGNPVAAYEVGPLVALIS